MATPNFVKMIQGLDNLPVGPLVKNNPWTVGAIDLGVDGPDITASGGKFGGRSMGRSAAGPYLRSGLSYPGGGMIGATGVDPRTKMIMGLNFWFKLSTAVGGLGTLIYDTPGSTAAYYPLFGVTVSNGVHQAVFPGQIHVDLNAAPILSPIMLGQWNFVDMRIAYWPANKGGAAGQYAYGTYQLNGANVATDLQLTVQGNMMGGQPSSMLFFDFPDQVGIEFDDIVVRYTTGAETQWPAGFNSGVPNDPTGPEMMPSMTPRRIYHFPLTGNGSVTQFTPSSGSNWQAAQTSGQTVTATDVGQTDLYKTTASGLSDIDCVQISANSSKYQSLTPAVKPSGGAVQVGTGALLKGPSSFTTVVEEFVDGTQITQAAINAAEFGQQSL